MNRTRTTVVATLVGAALMGCQTTDGSGASDEPGRQIERSTAHDWPPVLLDSSGREHVVVMQAPNPGWRLELDAVQTARGGQIVYVTARRPDPDRMYPQVITTKRIGTTVASDRPAEVVVRLAGPDGEGPYHPAASVE